MTGIPLTVTVQEGRGTFSLAGPKGAVALPPAWMEFETEDGTVYTTCQAGFAKHGKGWVSSLEAGKLRLEVHFTKSPSPATGMLVEASLRNGGEDSLRIRRFSVLRCRVPARSRGWGAPENWRVLRMGYTFGGAHREDEDWRDSSLVGFPQRRGTAKSFGMAAVRLAQGGLVAGFTTAHRQMTWVEVSRDGAEGVLSATCELEGSEIEPGKTARLETLYLGFHNDPVAGTAAYGRLFGESMKCRPRPVPAGWCSWYNYRADATENDVMANAKFAREKLAKTPFSVVQVDDGWAPAYGDWTEVRADRFPGGLAELARGIRGAGFVPGIWVAPFTVQQHSKLYREHPEWLIKDADGAPLAWEVEWAEPKTPWYGLDASHPEAIAWLKSVFTGLKAAGFGYFKLDFLFMGALRGSRVMPVTRVEAFRQGLAAIRQAVGNTYILACTAPYPPCAGLVDGARTSHDIFPGGDLAGCFRVACSEASQRSWTHGALWNADPDTLVVRPLEGVDPAVAGAIAQAAVLSGGALFSGDALPDLPPDRFALTARAFRMMRPVAGVPLDLFEAETPRLVAQPLGRGHWRVGVFNFDPLPRAVAFDLNRLGLKRAEVTFYSMLEPGATVKARGRVLTPPIPARGAVLLDIRGK